MGGRDRPSTPASGASSWSIKWLSYGLAIKCQKTGRFESIDAHHLSAPAHCEPKVRSVGGGAAAELPTSFSAFGMFAGLGLGRGPGVLSLGFAGRPSFEPLGGRPYIYIYIEREREREREIDRYIYIYIYTYVYKEGTYIYIYIYIYMSMYVYIYISLSIIHIYIERERDIDIYFAGRPSFEPRRASRRAANSRVTPPVSYYIILNHIILYYIYIYY